MPKLCILIPAYNCAPFLRQLIEKTVLPSANDEVIVLDDGSKDDTFSIARSLPRVAAYRNEKNMGYGYTSHALYRLALNHGADVAIHMHGDIGHDPANIAVLFERFQMGECDLVYGSRLLFLRELLRQGLPSPLDVKKRNNMPLIRVAGHFGVTAIQNICYGTKLHCFHDGMRLASRKAIEWIVTQDLPSWYDYDVNLLVRLHKTGFRIAELAVPPFYSDLVNSSAPPFRYGFKCAWNAVKFRFGSK